MSKHDALVGRIGLVVLMATGTVACVSRAGLERAVVAPDPNTEIGRAMIEVTRDPGAFPRFADIPKVASDSALQNPWASSAQTVSGAGAALNASVAALPAASASLSEAQADKLRAAAAIEPPSADSAARTEAFARSLRQRAKPPPAPR